MRFSTNSTKEEKLYKWLAFVAIAAGIAVRIAVYLQNRNLMIDEANVARNIYERGFAMLCSPLSYEQYAPPLWLWAVKATTLLWNIGEQALRFIPLASGFATLILLYLILKQLNLLRSAWYALLLLASGYIYIRYSTELKQYMTDAATALALILLALRTSIDTKPTKSFIIWLLAGSISIWLSMPSVFILAGVGFYYLVQYWQQGTLKKVWPIVSAAILWVAQFLLYYLLILKEQANSEYLQNFHKDYFLSATPTTLKEIDHNMALLGQILGETAGFTFLAKTMHTGFIIWACVMLFRKNRPVFAMLAAPLALLLIAAAANQYTLITRVVLFMMPLLLILIAYGLDRLLQFRNHYFKVLVLAACAVCVVNVSAFRFFVVPMHSEQITDGMGLCIKNNIPGNAVFLHTGAVPQFIYYTTVHPDKEKWKPIANAHQLNWDVDWSKISGETSTPCAFIFTSIYEEELQRIRNILQQTLNETEKREEQGSYTYIYYRK